MNKTMHRAPTTAKLRDIEDLDSIAMRIPDVAYNVLGLVVGLAGGFGILVSVIVIGLIVAHYARV